jgi:NAD-dependent SIR2 family protein deacetylase
MGVGISTSARIPDFFTKGCRKVGLSLHGMSISASAGIPDFTVRVQKVILNLYEVNLPKIC